MPETEAKEAPKKTATSGLDKAVEHLAEAVKKVAGRIVFLSEGDQKDVEDHAAAAVAHAHGNSKAAKEANERIAERNPDE